MPSRARTIPPMTSTELARFFSYIDDSGDCWLWSGNINNTSGYGRHCFNKTSYPAHRVMYQLEHGFINEKNKTIDHLCRNRACVNPDHLELVTNAENIRRGLNFAGKNSRKTHCPRGHEYTEDNTRVSKRNQRSCKGCEKINRKIYVRRNRDKIKRQQQEYYKRRQASSNPIYKRVV